MKGKLAALALILLLFSCNANMANANNIASKGKNMKASDITTETKIRDIISNPSLGDWGTAPLPCKRRLLVGRHAGRFAAHLVQPHKSPEDRGNSALCDGVRGKRRTGLLRHLQRRRKTIMAEKRTRIFGWNE